VAAFSRSRVTPGQFGLGFGRGGRLETNPQNNWTFSPAKKTTDFVLWFSALNQYLAWVVAHKDLLHIVSMNQDYY